MFKLNKKPNRLAFWQGEYDLMHLACVIKAYKTLHNPSELNSKGLDYFIHELECIKSVIRRIKKL